MFTTNVGSQRGKGGKARQHCKICMCHGPGYGCVTATRSLAAAASFSYIGACGGVAGLTLGPGPNGAIAVAGALLFSNVLSCTL